jgi:hypothetical protein
MLRHASGAWRFRHFPYGSKIGVLDIDSGARDMKAILCCAAGAALVLSGPGDAKPASPEQHVVGAVAEATALSEFCVNWAIDPVEVARLLRNRKIQVDGRYREIFGAAYARAHADGNRGGNFPAACDRGLDLYGPQGHKIGSLVRPAWNGACGDCRGADWVVLP